MTFPIAIQITGRAEPVLRTFKTLKDAREQARRLAHEGVLVERDSIAVAGGDPAESESESYPTGTGGLGDLSIFVDAFYPPHRIERVDILTMEVAPEPSPETEPATSGYEPLPGLENWVERRFDACLDLSRQKDGDAADGPETPVGTPGEGT